jgi:hypothetical protein
MADAGIFNGTRIKDNTVPDIKLQTISTAGKVANSATTATSANTNSAIVARDGSGGFSAGAVSVTTLTTSTTAVNANRAANVVAQGGSGGATNGGGNSVLFGHSNSGFTATLGAFSGLGYPLLGFYCYHSATASTMKRASATNLPSLLYVDTNGNLVYQTAPAGTVDADITNFTTRLQIANTGQVTIGDGSGIANLAAGNLASGTVPLARLSGITTSQLSATAGIVYAQLSIANSIVNADIAAAAAIAYSKLALANSITNADLAGSIADTKLLTISTAGKVANSATTATNANTASAIVARDGSGNFAANMISIGGTPTNGTDVATKAYVDAAVQGLDVKASVRVATTAALTGTYASGPQTFTLTATGVLTIDGVATVLNDRILVKDQVTASQNGIYTVTTAGAVGVAAVLTRASDMNTSAEASAGSFTFVEEGTVNDNSGWVLTSNQPITLDTTSLAFTQFSGAGQVIAGNGISKSGNTLSVLNADGTISVTVSGIAVATGSISNTHIATGAAIAYSKLSLGNSIVNADIAAGAAIVDTKLATISTAGKVANSATTGTASNTVNTLVLRDANGRTQMVDPSAAQDVATRNFVDTRRVSEVPSGTVNGTNQTFTLSNTPRTGSLDLFLNGIRLELTTHYTLSTNTITFVSGFQPDATENFRANYLL